MRTAGLAALLTGIAVIVVSVLAAFLERASATAPAMGAAVSIIGHPGMGDQILEHTMTTGVISNPKRSIEGVNHIQTNASVNPGCSGAPLFNERGNVIGLVVLKARMEGVAFAVPRDELEKFLRGAVKK